ncbi:hypothetical protein ACIQRS_00080 [Streptomyces termitum]|uniref:DUF3558 domain-containing protein n=1 Tax=Streptomyces termitum TaxID=67368 RepID=A0A918WAK7_9ACTN|nr:hypothetical protein [Streptomyces termitum]GHA99257.1 hypothetical protein GCM10010305_48220 [Streptomyces termitum]
MKHAKSLAPLALALLLAGCSQPPEEKRAFEVPGVLCGTEVSPALLSPLLPAGGEEIEVKRSDLIGGGMMTCKVSVDGATALSLGWNWGELGEPLRRAANDNPYLKLAKQETPDGRVVYGEESGATRVTCEPVVAHRKGNAELIATLKVFEGRPDADAVKNLLVAYAKELEVSSEECVRKK